MTKHTYIFYYSCQESMLLPWWVLFMQKKKTVEFTCGLLKTNVLLLDTILAILYTYEF